MWGGIYWYGTSLVCHEVQLEGIGCGEWHAMAKSSLLKHVLSTEHALRVPARLFLPWQKHSMKTET